MHQNTIARNSRDIAVAKPNRGVPSRTSSQSRAASQLRLDEHNCLVLVNAARLWGPLKVEVSGASAAGCESLRRVWAIDVLKLDLQNLPNLRSVCWLKAAQLKLLNGLVQL